MKDAFLDEEYLELVNDLIYHPEVVRLRNYRHHKVSNRYKHSVEVSYLAYRMALRLKMDEVDVARGALLHDLYYYDTDIKDKDSYIKHLITHPQIALKNASKIAKVTPVMENIILSHMYCGTKSHPTPECKEAWLVSLADKLTSVDDMGEYISYIGDFVRVYYRERRRLTLEQYSLMYPILI